MLSKSGRLPEALIVVYRALGVGDLDFGVIEVRALGLGLELMLAR